MDRVAVILARDHAHLFDHHVCLLQHTHKLGQG